ncbi:MAG: 50S ribosomal protein L30e [Methanosarcinaceae archaeon]|nr:50S ribosomal protein L30e [Methanosarcinaceae archaeon]MDD4497849.1 50S ribosomal protein L30e [Methanosarcinaceae archaeon]
MDINIDKSLIKVMRTGSVIIGTNLTIDAAEQGNAKLVVLASNCPENVKARIQATGTAVLVYEGTNVDLGPVCGKPFTIAAMAIIEVGESDIMAAVA